MGIITGPIKVRPMSIMMVEGLITGLQPSSVQPPTTAVVFGLMVVKPTAMALIIFLAVP